MAISIVSSAMLPVMGLLGVGMNAAQDSLKSSTSAHIMQQVASLVQNRETTPFYFSATGDRVVLASEAVYMATVESSAPVNDATRGLAANKLNTIVIKHMSLSEHTEYTRSFTVTSQNPASLWQGL